MIKVRWTGAAGLEFSHNGVVYLMDPYLSRAGKIELLFKRLVPRRDVIMHYLSTLPGELKAVMIGHTHFDHALDIPHIAEATSAQLIGSASLAKLLDACGMKDRVTLCQDRERISLSGGAAVTMIPARHGKVLFGRIPYPGEIDSQTRLPGKARDYRHGQVFNILLELGGISFLHIGSAGLIDTALEGQACDVLFLCQAGWKNTPDYLPRILSRVRPTTIVPFHFDDFTAPVRAGGSTPSLPLLGKKRFQDELAHHAPQAQVLWPEIHKAMMF